jgi:hypothetical protein
MAKRWFKTKPWRLLERGEPVPGDCSVELHESDEGMSIAITEFLGRGTTLTRIEAVLVEEDWDRLVAAVTQWRSGDADGAGEDAGRATGSVSDLDGSELVRLAVGLCLSRAAGAVQRGGERAAGWLGDLALRTAGNRREPR